MLKPRCSRCRRPMRYAVESCWRCNARDQQRLKRESLANAGHGRGGEQWFVRPVWWDSWIAELASRANRQQPLFDDAMPAIDLDRLSVWDAAALRERCRCEMLEVAA